MRVVRDEAAFQERVQRTVAGRTANELDAGARNWLPVGDPGQHLQRRLRQRHRPRIAQVPLDRRGHLGCGHQAQLIGVPLQCQA